MPTETENIFLALGRLEGKMDAMIRIHSGQQEQLNEHEKRIRELEHSKSRILGGSAVIAAVASVAIQYIIRVANQ